MKTYSIVIYIPEKIYEKNTFDKFITILQEKYNYIKLSFSSTQQGHLQAILVKSADGEIADKVLRGVKKQLSQIELDATSKINFKLTVAGAEVVTDDFFVH